MINRVKIDRFGSRAGGTFARGPVVMTPYESKTKREFKQIKKKVKKLNKAYQAEVRTRIISQGTLPLLQAGDAQLCNGMQYGDQDNNRDGNSVNMLSVNYAYDFTVVPGNVPTGNGAVTVRVMLLYDKQANAGVFNTNDLLETGGSASLNYLAPIRFEYRKRFHVFLDRTHYLNLPATSRAGVAVTQFDYAPKKFKIKRRINKRVMYNDGNTGNITDIISGALYFVVYPSISATWFESRMVGHLTYTP